MIAERLGFQRKYAIKNKFSECIILPKKRMSFIFLKQNINDRSSVTFPSGGLKKKEKKHEIKRVNVRTHVKLF